LGTAEKPSDSTKFPFEAAPFYAPTHALALPPCGPTCREERLSTVRERALFSEIARASIGTKVSPHDPAYAQRLDFALSRFAEGERSVALLERLFPELMARRPLIVLDLGSGNGGMLFPFSGRGRLLALDVYIDHDIRAYAQATLTDVAPILGSADQLPFADESLDVIVLAEVIEHLSRPSQAGREIARVLRPGGVCLVSTPPRLKFLLRPDPHYGIRGLLLLPDFLQRYVARTWFKRREYGSPAASSSCTSSPTAGIGLVTFPGTTELLRLREEDRVRLSSQRQAPRASY
jgi:SAM-dependent methyltransferase